MSSDSESEKEEPDHIEQMQVDEPGVSREASSESEKERKRKRKKERKKEKKRKKKEKKKGKKKRKVVVKGLKATPKLATGLEMAAEAEEQKRKALESRAAEGSVEFWNDQRAKLGLKPLKE